MRQGDAAAGERAMKTVYSEIHSLASRFIAGERSGHTLEPTALVNEAYLRLIKGPERIANRHHFFALAAQAMRRVLVDHARQKRAGKRGSGVVHLNVDEAPIGTDAHGDVDILALDQALDRLAKLAPKAAKVIELRFFGGNTDKEVCQILGENLATIRREWEFGRAWLKHRLETGGRA
jgi:RNA polymerase sigma factor (TIGR02999 family)